MTRDEMAIRSKGTTIKLNVALIGGILGAGAAIYVGLKQYISMGFKIETLEKQMDKVESLSSKVSSLNADFESFRSSVRSDLNNINIKTTETSSELRRLSDGVGNVNATLAGMKEAMTTWKVMVEESKSNGNK